MDAETRSPVGEPLVGVTVNFEWVGDEALVYITMDEILRPYKVIIFDKSFFCINSLQSTLDL